MKSAIVKSSSLDEAFVRWIISWKLNLKWKSSNQMSLVWNCTDIIHLTYWSFLPELIEINFLSFHELVKLAVHLWIFLIISRQNRSPGFLLGSLESTSTHFYYQTRVSANITLKIVSTCASNFDINTNIKKMAATIIFFKRKKMWEM